MRVGYVVKRYPRYSETFVVSEILAHEASGLDIDIFSLRPPADTHFQDVLARVKAGVTYVPAGKIGGDALWAALAQAAGDSPRRYSEAFAAAQGVRALDVYQAAIIAAEVRERGITHLHAHFASVATTVTRLAAMMSGVPYSFTAHAKDIYHETVEPEDLRRKMADATAVVTVSDFNADYLRQQFGPDARSVRRIYNGLDLDAFHFSADHRETAKLVAVGRLVEKKGFDILIDACDLLARDGVEFTCDIVGDGELRPALAEHIERAGLSSKVTLAGPLPQAEVKHRVARASLFAAPCRLARDGNRDGLPTVLLEAMALGTACVSTQLTGIPEMIRHGEGGLLVPPEDPFELAAALKRLLEDPALRQRLAQNARMRVESDFNILQNAARVRKLFTVRAVNAWHRECALAGAVS